MWEKMEAAEPGHGSGVRACLCGEREPGCGFGGSGMSLRGGSRCFAAFARPSVPMPSPLSPSAQIPFPSVPLPSLLAFALSGRSPPPPLSLAPLAPFSCCISLRFSLALLCVYSCQLFFVKKGCHAVIYGRLA